jgi:hypothetical protein
MPTQERATSKNMVMARDSAIPPVTIKVPVPQNTKAPAQPATSSTQTGNRR